MRILLATDAWEPQVNGVVRTLTRTVEECRAMGHQVEVVSPDQFKTFPLPTYPEIKLAMGAYEPVQERFKSFEPEAIHIATENGANFLFCDGSVHFLPYSANNNNVFISLCTIAGGEVFDLPF